MQPETQALTKETDGIEAIFKGENVILLKDLAKYILRCHRTRHPEEEDHKNPEKAKEATASTNQPLSTTPQEE